MQYLRRFWATIIPLIDRPWKIALISTTVSAVLSTILTALAGGSPLVGFLIGTVIAFLISYPISLLTLNTLQIINRQNAELRQLNQELDTYSHTVAHNMKNTITSIGLASELIQMQSDPTGKIHKNAEKINRLTYALADTIESLLLLASIRGEEVEMLPVDMAEAFEMAKLRLEEQIDTYQPEIKLPDHWDIGLGYTPWIVEIWVNLLSNAMKYGGTPPVIHLGSERCADNSVRFWIRDNGRGLEQEEQQQLFKKFTQLERIDGHGLGLSIVAQIALRLDGLVGVESDGKNSGSCFYFTLPASG